MSLAVWAVPFGQLIAAAFACGFNLYATVAVVGIASRFGWFDGLPTALHGLENEIVIGSAIVLFTAEAIVDKARWVDSLWDAVHTFIRPLAAGLLAGLALTSAGSLWAVSAAICCAAAALAAHATKAGLRVALHARNAPRTALAASLTEDALAIAIATAAVLQPEAAAATAAALAIGLPVFGRRYWRAAAFGARAALARLRGFFAGNGWYDARRLPNRLRGLADVTPHAFATVHAARAAVIGLPGAGAYRNGWLVFERDATAFLFRSRFRPRRIDVPALQEPRIVPGALADAVIAKSDRGTIRIFLLKDGPAPETTVAELTSTTTRTAATP